MSRLYRRVWAVEVAGRRYEGLDMQARAAFSSSEPAQAEVTLYNPPREVVGALHDRATTCRVLAGYLEEGPVEVFLGTPIPGSVSDRLADAEPAVIWQLSAARAHVVATPLSRSWGEVRGSEVIEALRRHMGLARDYVELPTDVAYRRHVIERSPLEELATVVRDCGAVYSIEGGRLRVYPRDGSVPRTADVWAPGSGLLDVVGPDGDGEVRAAALLRPALRPGDVVAVRSPRWSGEVLVQSVTHEVQTDGDRWATSIAGVPRA